MAVYKYNGEKREYSSLRKKIGISILIFCLLCFVCLLTNLVPFAKNFLLGSFGLFSYCLFVTLFIIGLALINNRKYVMTISYILYLSFALISLLAILQLIFVDKGNLNFFEYLGKCYTDQMTPGGFLIGLFTAPIIFLLNNASGYIIYSLSLVVFVALIIDYIYYERGKKKLKQPIKIATKPKTPQPDAKVDARPLQNIVLEGYLQSQKSEGPSAKARLGLSTSQNENSKPLSKRDYLLSTPNIDLSELTSRNNRKLINKTFDEIKQSTNTPPLSNTPNFVEHDSFDYIKPNTPNNLLSVDDPDFADNLLKSINKKEVPRKTEIQSEEPVTEKVTETFTQKPIITESVRVQESFELPKATIKPKQQYYNSPSIDLLTTQSVDLSLANEEVVQKRAQLENALEEFGIPAKVIGVVIGPAVTRYELEMPAGISVKKIMAHADDIALALASNGGVRIEAPIPGRSAVGVEVPNDKIATVGIKEILQSKDFVNSRNFLSLCLGKDISGKCRVANLQKMPHLLVAGATNSGKSVALNSFIISMLYKASPNDLRMILIDPKHVEFGIYNNLPHLLIPKVITELDKAINALNWCIDEMERRYRLFENNNHVRNLTDYNASEVVLSGMQEKLPFIVLIVDELSDLMMMNKKEIEEKIIRLGQKSRAAGIHMILATQRPSVDVITGTIKANLPARVAFAVTSFADSKTILDISGAEKLLGRGDMLYSAVDAAEPVRVQGSYVTDQEIQDVVNYVKEHNDYDYDASIVSAITNPQKSTGNPLVDDAGKTDPLLKEALRAVILNGTASMSLLQRKLVVGWPRAAKIIDQLESAGYVGKGEGSKPRAVLITIEEFNQLFGDIT